MRAKIIIIILTLLVLLHSASAIKVNEAQCNDEGQINDVHVYKCYDINANGAQCYDDGSIKIVLKANNEKEAYTKDMFITADDKRVKGSWEGEKLTILSGYDEKIATFTGIENQLTEQKTYSIKLAYKEVTGSTVQDAELTFDLECPGLIFTCKRLGIKINDCLTSKRGKFTANLDIYGLEQSEKGSMDPLKVIDYMLETQILYKDIKGYTSKLGSLPDGATITKTGANQYKIEAEFDKYTTNHVKNMWINFNNNMIKQCKPSQYSDIILSGKKQCAYKETEEDMQAEKEETKTQEAQNTAQPQELPVDQLVTNIYNEISDLETKKTQIDERLNELYQKRSELNELQGKEEESKTGYSIKEPESKKELTTSEAKKKSQLKILLLLLSMVIVIGGGLLGYLYKQGYFY